MQTRFRQKFWRNSKLILYACGNDKLNEDKQNCQNDSFDFFYLIKKAQKLSEYSDNFSENNKSMTAQNAIKSNF